MTRRLGDWLTSYMEYTDQSEPPELFHTWTGISTIAACLQRKCVINWGPISFFPNMYIVLCAPPGKARKGTAMSYGSSFLAKLGVKRAAESITREALVREIMEAYQTTINDTTGEMTFHSSITIFSKELGVLLGFQQQQLMMDLTDWFDCGDGPDGKWTYRTKHQGTDDIIGIWVNLIGATTPGMINSDTITGGLSSRIIFVYESEKRKSCPVMYQSPEIQSLGEDLYYDLEQILLMKGQFKPSSDFIDLWVDWYVAQEGRKIFSTPHLEAYCERRAVHVMKLSMILSASEGDSMIITGANLQRAITLLERTERNMPQVFSGVGKSPHAEILSKVMTEVGLAGEITKSELLNKFYHDADDRVMEAIIETLRSMGFIDRVERNGQTILRYIKKTGVSS